MSRKIVKHPRVRALALALAAGIAVASCAYPTPYQAAGTASDRTGYSDQQIEGDRFQVTFAGNSLTSRETVERYLLYRAAELTLQRGFDHFVLVSRDTETRTTTTVDRWGPGGYGAGSWGYGYWRPHWRWYRPSFGWRSWDPFYDDPFMRDFDVQTINRYEATAEIVAGRGPKPTGNVRAFDARDVVDRLGPSIEMPKPR